jgi:hypothetical protein
VVVKILQQEVVVERQLAREVEVEQQLAREVGEAAGMTGVEVEQEVGLKVEQVP